MVDELTPAEVKARLDRGDDLQVVDIRLEREFEAGHIPGAVNLPFDRFAREVADHEWGETIVVVCPIGESSRQAARLLESYEGLDGDTTVANMTGGYRAWEYDLEAGPEE